MYTVDEFRVHRAGGTWGVQDGGSFHPHATETLALSYAMGQALQADSLGRVAKVVHEDANGRSSIVWQSFELADCIA
jgi:hypothetical protein